ncbi:STAS domain-containing protein [Streptomyces sp. IBSNAI002]|uniref:STAS domain-containing protein n=1 Tax=Streptomyces sp. IBSNAI002 TaxID=3457500 RepID=UPI003FD125BD
MPSPGRPDRSVPTDGVHVHPAGVPWADAVARCAPTGAGAAPTLTARPLRDRPGTLLSGSCDLDTRPILRAALGAVTRIPGPVVHLDLSAVAFLDAASVAALLQAASTVTGQGRRLLLHDPPYSLRKIVAMFPDECAALEVAA